MACHECQRARETAGRFAWYCPLCLWCGARLIRRLGTLKRSVEEITERREKVLADWMAYGHAEAELRSLAKQPGIYEPIGQDAPEAPAAPKQGKRR